MARGVNWSTVFLLMLLLVGFLWWQGWLKLPSQSIGPGQQTTQQGANLVSVTKPLQIGVTDPLGGGGIGSASVKIYGSDKVLKESLTTDSTGKATSTLPYTSGTQLYIQVSAPGYVTRWFSITVPSMSPQDAQSLTTNFIGLQTYKLGTFVIKVVDQSGNAYASGSTYNFTAAGTSSVTFTISIFNTADNTGYITSIDPINGINQQAVLLMSTGGSSVVVQGPTSSVQRGTTTYWSIALPDDGLTRQLVGTTYVKPGSTSVVITFQKGALAHTQSQAFTFVLYAYFDPANFAAQGVGGPNQQQLATFTITLAA